MLGKDRGNTTGKRVFLNLHTEFRSEHEDPQSGHDFHEFLSQLYATHAAVRATGRPREQILGHTLEELFPDAADTTLESHFHRAMDEGIHRAFDFHYPDFDTWWETRCYPAPEGLAVFATEITERKQAEEELRRLSGRLLRLQDEERRKIARDLHDSTGQDLVALSAIFSQLNASLPSSGRKLRKLASQGQSLTERCIREVRTLSYLLHPPMLDESGLEDALHHFVHGFAERTGIQVELEVSPNFRRLAPEIELGLFRVVQESLINIQRHSGSFTAKTRLLRDAEKSTLEVSDEGRGISCSKKEHKSSIPLVAGVGIPSMEERAQQVGGRLEIESGSGGTTVRVMIPVHE